MEMNDPAKISYAIKQLAKEVAIGEYTSCDCHMTRHVTVI